jgi:hypothetical protein
MDQNNFDEGRYIKLIMYGLKIHCISDFRALKSAGFKQTWTNATLRIDSVVVPARYLRYQTFYS